MKNIFWILFLLTASVAFCQNNEEEFLKGNKFYSEGKYQDALNCYSSIDLKGQAVWFNMGNTFFKMKRYPAALLSWKRAYKQSSFNQLQSIEKNISVLNEKLGNSEDTIWGQFFSFICRYSFLFSTLVFQLLFLLFWFLLIIFFRRFWREDKFIYLLFLLLINILLAEFIFAKYSIYANNHAIVMKNVDVLAGPGDKFHKLFELKAASEVDILDSANQWTKCRKNGLIGWIQSEIIKMF
ncbi:MAG: hypothetical protein UR26_C0003G0143 [candidate division TM6 bacterium GW2011_GWF2_32_72]|nr:MAG: hypothetical protein UR26_C0003G0143 [candidate division TM6 bacterium GW2011_GWF2_32_72]